MTKIWVVARHEFVTTVRRLGFLIVTVGIPLLMLGIFGITILLQTRSQQEERTRIQRSKLGIVDRSGLLTRPVPEGTEWIRFSSVEEGRPQMSAGSIQTLLVVPEDYLQTGRVRVLTTHRPTLFGIGQKYVPDAFEDYLARCVLSEESPVRIARARRPVVQPITEFLLPDASGPAAAERPEDYLKRLSTAGFFFFLLFMSTSVAGGYLIQGVADEKENRVLEMVISSVTPNQLMTGKLLGLGAAGLLQVAIWSVLGVFTALGFVTSFVLNPLLFPFCGLVYLLGYLLYGSLLLGIGSLGSNQREATQYTWALSLFNAVPIIFWFYIFSEPQSTLARVFTWFPLTSPSTLIARVAVDPTGTPPWEVAAVLVFLALCVFLSIRFSARLYRVGLLLYGKRPTPREIWRWLRAA